MKKNLGTLFLVILVICLIFISVGSALAETIDESAQEWEVSVGKETDDASLDSMFPKVLYVHEGDTVTFTNRATF
jgi:plastocyanin